MQEESHEAFRARWEARLGAFRARDGGRRLAGFRVVTLPGSRPPWTDTGLEVARGDALTILARGRVAVSEALGLWSGPRFALWAQVGERGRIWKGTQDTQTRAAPDTGTVRLALPQGEWASPEGRIETPPEAYAGVGGAIDAVLLRWRGEAAEGLAALDASAPGDPLIGAERQRLARPVSRPGGWEYLWRIGDGDLFAAAEVDGRPAIAACFENDVGILRRRIDFPLGADTTLSWRWRVSRLPSAQAEDQLLHHDYVSLALEFENGRDLTWHWSASLPPETGYACPIPQWTPRETHVVVRSGAAGLGAWQRERRSVRADYARHVGPPPERIVAAWLIAVSIFQHGSGAAEFADVVLEGDGRRLEIV